MMQCLCGNNEKFIKQSHGYYYVTISGKIKKAKTKLAIKECSNCGIKQQAKLPFKNMEDYYKKYPPVNSKYKIKDYEHDLTLAEKRLGCYNIQDGSRVLDIGCGSGAFVDVCREYDIEAYGCEITRYAYMKGDGDYIYWKKFEDIYFPTDYFDWVALHDVLEHSIDPLTMLKEAFRVLKQEGNLVIDFPDFYHKAGEHHWKKEHLWYISKDQMRQLLDSIGFIIKMIKKPIDSKLVFYCEKPIQKRTRILVPPGIGDSLWSISKLESFFEQKKIEPPVDVIIASPKNVKYNSHERAFDFLRMYPFVNVSGEVYERKKFEHVWREAYSQPGNTIFTNVPGVDYFVSYNGHLAHGANLENIDSNIKANWHPKRFVSLKEEKAKREAKEKYGDYIVFYFVFQGTYKHWTNEFPVEYIVDYINEVTSLTGLTGLLVGAVWDKDELNSSDLASRVDCVDLRGKTTINEVFGIIRGSQAVVGYPSGLTIMSAILGTKTLIIWNDYYNRDFWRTACPSEIYEKNYFIETTSELTTERLREHTIDILEDRKFELIIPKKSERKVMPVLSKPKPSVITRKGNGKDRPVEIFSVLKSGGSYTQEDVEIMANMLDRNIILPYEFKILTDKTIPNISCVLMENNWGTWWPKIELFKMTGPAIYFDLDMVISDSLDDFVYQVSKMPWGEFRMCNPFNPEKKFGPWNSGIMAWYGNFKYIYRELTKDLIQKIRLDQMYIANKLMDRHHRIEIKPIQQWINLYSFKRHCRDGLPSDADIIHFHGKQHIRDYNDPWIGEYYR